MDAAPEFQWLPDLLRAQDPGRPFVRFKDRALTYGEFDARTDALAGGLGIEPGDVVSVFLPNGIDFLEAWWAILKAGGVLGPINPAYTRDEAGYIVEHSEAVALITDTRGASLLGGLTRTISVDEGMEEGPTPDVTRSRDDLAAILYTSGTTGRPKGAMLTHGNELVNAVMGAEVLPLTPGDRVGMLLPLFHANAQVVTVLIPMLIGLEVVMWERFSASTFWETVAELKPVSLSAVPTILATVLNAPDAPGPETSLRYVICGAAPLSVELLEAFQNRFGIRILEGYGLTETTCISSLNPYYGNRKAGSIGLPVRGQQMRISGEAGSGEYGEILLKGPNVMAGYLKNPEATAESIRDGWLHTGDIGYVDEDGYFYIVDRTKDMIIRGGENIYPREIEEVLYAFGGVQECAVIGIPDPVRGEEVLAVIAPAAGVELDLDALAAFAAERIARYKLPRRFELRETLPKTPTGKISKGPLRDELG